MRLALKAEWNGLEVRQGPGREKYGKRFNADSLRALDSARRTARNDSAELGPDRVQGAINTLTHTAKRLYCFLTPRFKFFFDSGGKGAMYPLRSYKARPRRALAVHDPGGTLSPPILAGPEKLFCISFIGTRRPRLRSTI